MPDPSDQSPLPIEPQPVAPPADSGLLGRELGGDLPCFVCGYNLRGLSVRSMCPECGTLVRATILSLVDPLASELRPIPRPRLLAAGLILWAVGAVMAATLSWLPHASDLLALIGVGTARPNVTLGVGIGVALSGLGALALIRPHAGLPVRDTLFALLAALLYIPLAIVLWKFHIIADFSHAPRYITGWSPTHQSTLLLVSTFLLIAGIILLQRPMARTLVARSLLMRTGRVDRQTMYAMAIAALIAAAGASLGWMARTSSTLGETARMFGIILITFGSLLLTIGMLGSLLDAARIAQAVLTPRLSLKQVIRHGRPAPKSTFGRLLDPTPRGDSTPTPRTTEDHTP